MKYNIGQKITLAKEIESKSIFGEKSLPIRKGTEMYIGADKHLPQVLLSDGNILLLPKDTEIDGYSVNGIADWIFGWLCRYTDLENMIEESDVSCDDFKEEIANALEELGMYDNTHNRS